MSRQTAYSTLVVALAIAALILASCGKEGEQKAAGDAVEWVVSMEEALDLAGKADRPIMIDVYADWCVWCKRLDSDTYSHEDVVAKAIDFVNLKLNADANRSVVKQYGVGGLPTILFLDSEGKEIHRVVGYKPPDQFVTEMETALTAFESGRG
jgi:thiol:disulfide interchange protein